ncbi:hypothetical protein [Arthrobacter sp. AET 35A]|uniref:hypothetical protein n=1 Tax=Arthrobacter sp. AET 35A TaxID=2292643 RepID=UPI001786234E|nr:hypothetical protein [Arthrobacter sp. AET 35A]
MLPKNAAAAIEEQTKFRFSVNDFTKMRHRDGVGPKKGHGPSAEYADGARCIDSKAHNSHVYTQAYIAAMIQELRDPAGHEAALGRAPEVPGSTPSPKQHPLAKQKK